MKNSQKTQTVPVFLNQEYTMPVTGLGHSGEGVGKYSDFTVFVAGALPGETVKVKISQVKKNYAVGRLLSVIEAAPERTEAKCPVYRECGGCQLQHLSYAGQLAAKHQTVVDAVKRIGKLENVPVHPVLGAEEPWYYRNKMQLPVGAAVDGTPVVGCYAQGSHRIVANDNCLIQHEQNNRLAAEVQTIVRELGIAPYNEMTGKGCLRHVLGRVGFATGEVMVVLVTAADQLPHKDAILVRLRETIPGLVSIVQNINTQRTNIILGSRTKTLWGRDTITDRLGPFTFHISALSFFQVNNRQTEILYEQAVRYAGLTGSETVIDAYCGTGTISLFLARQAAKVIGIEIVAPAIENAKRNAADNGVTNTEFITCDALDVMPKLYAQGLRPEVIVVDPPRAGCERVVLETFARMEPQRIVYVSCNPSSLARDLAVLKELGYQTKKIQPVDMFPQTYHVECVALIERKKP